MNSYSFVPKSQNYPETGNQALSILQRLEQLKQSMRPAQNLQPEYQSNNTNANFGQNTSFVQNHRLNKYLPKEVEEKIQNRSIQQGGQEFESYRKSLEKKLNHLFEKQKQILKTQSTFQPTKYNLAHQANFSDHSRYPNDLQKRYNQFREHKQFRQQNQEASHLEGRQKAFSNINYSAQPVENPISIQRNRIYSTIDGHYHLQGFSTRKDQQMEQMERKIKMLEMKYLGNYQQSQQTENHHQNAQNRQKNHENLSKTQDRSKSTKSRQKKQNTSPDRMKNKNKTSYKQTIQSKRQPQIPDNQSDLYNQDNKFRQQVSLKNQKKSPKKYVHPENHKVKQPIKDYLNTIDYLSSEHNFAQGQSPLHKEFLQLKNQFQNLLEINKSMIVKVEMSEGQKVRKRQKKQRAKAMLKQILIRLDEIKFELRNQTQSQLKETKRIVKSESKKIFYHHAQLISNKKMSPQKQLQSDAIKKKATLKISFDQNPKQISLQKREKSKKPLSKESHPNNVPKDEEVQKLKKLLQLEVQHRHIVEKKLEVMNGKSLASLQ